MSRPSPPRTPASTPRQRREPSPEGRHIAGIFALFATSVVVAGLLLYQLIASAILVAGIVTAVLLATLLVMALS